MDFINSTDTQNALAQVVVESEPLAEVVFSDDYNYADPSSSLFLWFLFAIALVSFAVFWFNREYLLVFLRSDRQDSGKDSFEYNQVYGKEVDYESFGSKTESAENNNKALSFEADDLPSIHDIPVESEQGEYKKPKLKLIMEEGEPKLVFD